MEPGAAGRADRLRWEIAAAKGYNMPAKKDCKDRRENMISNPFHFSPRPNRASEIGWQEWGEAAFAQARREAKPVMLAISAAWCHWCHMLDETTFSDPDVISLINVRFVPVRADSDRRPDLNTRYNQSGWPAISFLTPEGEIVGGSSISYLPPDEFKKLLGNLLDYYENSQEEIHAAVSAIQKERAGARPPAPGQPDEQVASATLQMIGDIFDDEFGGFGSELKFPFPNILSFLITTLADGFMEKANQMLRTTLDAMAAGGMYDRVDGGFFRYSTTRDWSVPHFEKMLADNGALLGIYADASLLTGEDSYAAVARDIHRYLSTVLLDPETGAFGGSQDADEEYYALERQARSKRLAPPLDRTVFAGPNAIAAAGLLRGYQVLGDASMRQEALAVLDFVWSRMWDAGAGLSHYFDGEPHLPGLLADVCRLLPACLDAYESGGGEAWLDRSLILARWLLDNLEDSENGGFFDCATAPGSEGYPALREKPIMENSVAAAALTRLAQTTGQTRFGEAARRALAAFAGVYWDRGVMAADYAAAVQRLLDQPVRVSIAGPPEEEATLAMIRSAHRALIPFRSIEVLDPALHGDDLEETGYGYAGQPVAYICIGASCQAPVTDPAVLPERLEKGRRQ